MFPKNIEVHRDLDDRISDLHGNLVAESWCPSDRATTATQEIHPLVLCENRDFWPARIACHSICVNVGRVIIHTVSIVQQHVVRHVDEHATFESCRLGPSGALHEAVG